MAQRFRCASRTACFLARSLAPASAARRGRGLPLAPAGYELSLAGRAKAPLRDFIFGPCLVHARRGHKGLQSNSGESLTFAWPAPAHVVQSG